MSKEIWLPKAELEKNPEYIECREYMAKHRIPEVLNDLLASVAFRKPEGGREGVMSFMAQQLDRRSKEGAEAGGLFDMKEIESVFHMADLLKQGTITREQVLDIRISPLAMTNTSRIQGSLFGLHPLPLSVGLR